MTTRHRYELTSRAAAEEAVAKYRAAETMTSICLQEVIAGAVEWLPRKGHYRAGLIRPDSPVGGYVILVWAPADQRPQVSCYTVDDLASRPGPTTTEDKDGLYRYEIAQLIRDLRNRRAAY